MSVTYNKPSKIKYTQMCMYIDAHLNDIVEAGKNPQIESTVYEYLYHVVYALARKGLFFRNFSDYDDFAVYAAGELFMSIRKKMCNAGKVIRGKTIEPLKSSLNYIKAVLHPLRVNYQQAFYQHIMDPEVGQDTSKMTYALKESIRMQYNGSLEESCLNIVAELPKYLHAILQKTPYRDNPVMISRLYNSCMLSLCLQLTLPNSKKKQLAKSAKINIIKNEKTTLTSYFRNTLNEDILLWHLDYNLKDYVKILVRRLKEHFSKMLREDIHADDLSENIVDSIIASAFMPQENQNSED